MTFLDAETLRRSRESFQVHSEPIAHLLRADDISDIILASPQRLGEPGKVWIDRVNVGLVDSGVTLTNVEAEQFIREVIAQSPHSPPLNEANPNVSCQAADGQFRFEAVIPPATPMCSFVLRKYIRRGDISLADYVADGSLSSEAANRLIDAIESSATVIVGGQTGSGKTTFLQPLIRSAAGVDVTKRIVLIEDTPELELPAGPQSRMHVQPNTAFGYQQAIFSALRQRPDTIVLGEVRRPVDAQQAVEAWTTGHQGLGTLHAGSCEEMLWRLYSLCRQCEAGSHMTVRSVASAIQVVVHIKKVKGRRVIDIADVDAKASGDEFVLRRWGDV